MKRDTPYHWDLKVYPPLQKSVPTNDNHHNGQWDFCFFLRIFPHKGVIDFLFLSSLMYANSQMGSFTQDGYFLKIISWAPMVDILRLCHLGISLVENSGYLLSIPSYHVILEKGND